MVSIPIGHDTLISIKPSPLSDSYELDEIEYRKGDVSVCYSKTREQVSHIVDTKLLETLVHELPSIPSEWKLIDLDSGFEKCNFQMLDSEGTTHTVAFIIPSTYPNSSASISTQVPLDIFLGSVPEPHRIRNVLESYTEQITSISAYLSLIHDIKTSVHVLDMDGFVLRIALAHHCTLQIKLNSQDIRGKPMISSFLGPDEPMRQHQQHMAKEGNSYMWSSNLDFLENLSLMIGLPMTYPGPNKENDNSISMIQDVTLDGEHETHTSFDCGICMSYKLGSDSSSSDIISSNGIIPNMICSNLKCAQAFHTTCLEEWFRALPTTRTTFHLLVGNCPYCQCVMPLDLSAKGGL